MTGRLWFFITCTSSIVTSALSDGTYLQRCRKQGVGVARVLPWSRLVSWLRNDAKLIVDHDVGDAHRQSKPRIIVSKAGGEKGAGSRGHGSVDTPGKKTPTATKQQQQRSFGFARSGVSCF